MSLQDDVSEDHQRIQERDLRQTDPQCMCHILFMSVFHRFFSDMEALREAVNIALYSRTSSGSRQRVDAMCRVCELSVVRTGSDIIQGQQCELTVYVTDVLW